MTAIFLLFLDETTSTIKSELNLTHAFVRALLRTGYAQRVLALVLTPLYVPPLCPHLVRFHYDERWLRDLVL